MRLIIDNVLGYAPEKIEYGINRYINETRRLYRTMDTHLEKSSSGFLVGDRLTIADISCWGWVASASTYPYTPLIDDPRLGMNTDYHGQSGLVLTFPSSPTSTNGS
jgi:glutathione S-transferase